MGERIMLDWRAYNRQLPIDMDLMEKNLWKMEKDPELATEGKRNTSDVKHLQYQTNESTVQWYSSYSKILPSISFAVFLYTGM